MRKLNRWKAIAGVTALLMGLGLVTSPGQVVRAVTTITQIGADINGQAAGDESGFKVAMSADGTRVAIGAWQPNSGNAGYVRIYTLTNGAWTQTGADIDGEAASDQSGYSVAMSSDGTRVAIGATGNDGNGSNAGHVRIYSWNGTTWQQTGTDIDGEALEDESGNSVAMSADGTRVAIGASSNGGGRGHVRVYTLIGNTWTQTGLDIDGERAVDYSGYSVAMSADGTRVAIGAHENDGTDDEAGHVRIYSWNGTAWTQTGDDIDGEAEEDYSGYSVAMSGDGTRVAIGATENDGNGSNAGHVRIYSWNGSAWTQTGADIDGEAASDRSGYSVAMSSDGTRVAIGAVNNENVSGIDAGHVRIYALQNFPSAPTISSVTAGDSSLRVSFTPGGDGGSAITNYKYSIDGTNYVALNPVTTTSPFTISGLTNGTTYSVTIKAVNGVGDSPASTAVSGTPVAPASTPSESNSSPTTAAATTTTAAATTTTTLSPTVTQPSAALVRSLTVREIVSSDNVTAGSSVKLTASGFTPSESVLVGVLGSTDTPSQVTADSGGAVATKVSIPADAAGKVTVYAYGQTSKRGYRQVVNVETAEELPATGSDSSLLTVFGVSLLATGLLFTARRRLTR